MAKQTRGRKPISETDPSITVSLRMTRGQRDKLARLGGAEWVRQQIEGAEETGAHIHTSRDGRGVREVFVDGRLVPGCFYADTRAGIVRAYVQDEDAPGEGPSFRLNPATGELDEMVLAGKVEVLFKPKE